MCCGAEKSDKEKRAPTLYELLEEILKEVKKTNDKPIPGV